MNLNFQVKELKLIWLNNSLNYTAVTEWNQHFNPSMPVYRDKVINLMTSAEILKDQK
jgi:hypothetical protein